MTEPSIEVWRQTVGDLTAWAIYLPSPPHQFEVTVQDGSGRRRARRIAAVHEPRFGLDVEDATEIGVVAEQLAQELEAGDGQP